MTPSETTYKEVAPSSHPHILGASAHPPSPSTVVQTWADVAREMAYLRPTDAERWGLAAHLLDLAADILDHLDCDFAQQQFDAAVWALSASNAEAERLLGKRLAEQLRDDDDDDSPGGDVR